MQSKRLFTRERARCQRQNTPMVVGIFDLDHFKRINDIYGHDLGDAVLRQVADLLSEPLRQSDVLGRFGGEEFVLLLPDTDLEESQAVAERLRRILEEAALEPQGVAVRITATFAVTQVQPEDGGIEAIIRRVDRALYAGKRAGRNCVVVAEVAHMVEKMSGEG